MNLLEKALTLKNNIWGVVVRFGHTKALTEDRWRKKCFCEITWACRQLNSPFLCVRNKGEILEECVVALLLSHNNDVYANRAMIDEEHVFWKYICKFYTLVSRHGN